MSKQIIFGLFVAFFAITVVAQTPSATKEPHLQNLRMLTHGGDNAEAYWSPNSKKLTFQSNRGLKADQIFWMDVKKAAKDSLYQMQALSTGGGRTTCSYFMPDGKHILYASTRGASDTIPSTGDLHAGGRYLWPIFDSYDIWVADLAGNITARLTDSPGYDAEATVSPKGDKIVFTSTRSGDLELWVMDIDGKNQHQVTSGLGYDGGAFFSPDGKQIVYRRSTVTSEAEIKRYKDLLAQHLIVPVVFEIWVMNADGTNKRQVTKLGSGSFAPFFTPDGKRIIFCTNYFASDPRKRNFDLVLVNVDGTGLERVTFNESFDGFPMFSPDGKKLVFASNRNAAKEGDTNVFIADWVN